MRITIYDGEIEINEISNERDLLELLKKKGTYYLFGEESERREKFYIVDFFFNKEPSSLGIGIISEGHGLSPEILVNDKYLWFGFNSKIIGFSIFEKKVVFTIDLDSLFYRFFPFIERQLLIIQHEIGLIGVNDRGLILWKFSRDVITNIIITDNNISLSFMDVPSCVLDITTGKIKH